MNRQPIQGRRAARRTRWADWGLLALLLSLLPAPTAMPQQNKPPDQATRTGSAGTSSSVAGDAPMPDTGNGAFPFHEPGMGPPGFGPFRHGRGGPMGGGPMGGGPMGGGLMGGGPMGGGGFGFGRLRTSIRRWEDADQQLQECRKKYEEIEARRQKLLGDLVAAKNDYHPEKMDPAAVLAQKTMDKVLGTLHQTVEDGRANTEEAGEILGGVLLTRNLWEPLLRRDRSPDAQGAGDAALRERRAAWLKGLERMDKDGPEAFARAVLGDAFGNEVFQAMPERMKRPFPIFHRGEGPLRRQLLENIRQNWLARIERMERRQEELGRELERQGKEIEQMRMIMDNVLNEPEDEGNPPPPPGTPQPAAPRPAEQPHPAPGNSAAH